MERAEAEAIYEQGREVVIAVLLRMDEQIARLEKRVAEQDERIARLERQTKRSSRNPSLEFPRFSGHLMACERKPRKDVLDAQDPTRVSR